MAPTTQDAATLRLNKNKLQVFTGHNMSNHMFRTPVSAPSSPQGAVDVPR